MFTHAVPRWGTPNASPSPSPHRPQRPRHNTPDQRRLFLLNGDHQTIPYRDMPPNHEAAAGPGRSEHRNVDILIPVARQRESLAGPNVPCERRTDPAEPPPPTSPRRQPQNSATATPRGAPPRDRRTLPVPWHLGPPHRAFLAIPTSDLFSNSPSPVPCRLDTGG